MLDVETKRRIDTARDILVGKVPDPKSQVEQITIALIYKFMDDMDAEAEELGGERTFFKGDFERYGWTRLMAPNMGGYDVIVLYSESIQKMNENPNIPQLFRDIFKNAYLPYRDPETLKEFLKVINKFDYDHSERLGDAFEYLLSVLGSQGEAGQFRTPRHIIDFMVEVIEPKKNESILDPACGTAGFLISSYKHIRKHNSSNFRPETDREAFDEKGVSIEELTLDSPKNYRGDLLTPDDRARLSGNIRGLDISPDMVRLSLVNMYLHGFTEPHIYEYDTLTSEERWNEFYDIILANPPFMSPKGGIRPHKRFSVQSNRSEVLFVDYIAEHLTPTGRAAVIVPEGIIFQSGTAYKQLRKMLVENYLFAVVSLPAGVFNPYSGVKTSILFMDRSLARKTNKILFVKIESDGFDLGAQRRPINRNDLPQALKAIKDYRVKVANGEVFEAEKWANVLVEEKGKIAGNGEYYLSGDKYREVVVHTHLKWPMVELGESFSKVNASVDPQTLSAKVNYVGLENIESTSGILIGDIWKEPLEIKSLKTKFKKGDILYGKLRPNLNKVWLAEFDGICSTDIIVLRASGGVLPELYAFILRSSFFNMKVLQGLKGAQLPRTSFEFLSQVKIPLPPLEVQNEIVAEIEGYQKIIDGARQVVENYKPQIQIDPKWEMVELGEVCTLIGGGTPSKQINEFWSNGNIKWISSKHINDEGQITGYETITDKAVKSSSTKVVPKGSTIAITRVSVGKIAFADDDYAVNQDLTGLVPKDASKLNGRFLFYAVKKLGPIIDANAQGLGVRGVTKDFLSGLKISLPDLDTQRAIVARIEKEQELVNANKELVRIFEQKIKDRIAAVWGES